MKFIKQKAIVAAMIFILVCCQEKEMTSQVGDGRESLVAEDEVTKFEGDWVFYGMHPRGPQNNLIGYSGVVRVRGLKLEFKFVRTAEAAQNKNDAVFPILEEQGAYVEYAGDLVPIDIKEAGMAGLYYIQNTNSVFDGLPIRPYVEDFIAIGLFDPPLVFRFADAPPYVEPEVELEEDVEMPDSDELDEMFGLEKKN